MLTATACTSTGCSEATILRIGMARESVRYCVGCYHYQQSDENGRRSVRFTLQIELSGIHFSPNAIKIHIYYFLENRYLKQPVILVLMGGAAAIDLPLTYPNKKS